VIVLSPIIQRDLQLFRAIVQSEPMDKVERSNRGAAATPQGIKPGAMTNDSFDTADSNDAGAASPATAPQDKPDNKPIKSKTNSRELLIDGEDRVETIREQTTTRTAAVKEVETPAQAPHEEGMKIADDGTQVVSGQANQNQGSQNKKPGVMLIDGTDTLENVQTGKSCTTRYDDKHICRKLSRVLDCWNPTMHRWIAEYT